MLDNQKIEKINIQKNEMLITRISYLKKNQNKSKNNREEEETRISFFKYLFVG